jgi:lysozyme
MKPSKKVVATSVAAAGFTAAVFTTVAPFLKGWEGTDLVAARDKIGTGHPITYCNGLTSTDGKVVIGQRFTPAQCDARLARALPTYLKPLQACIKRPVSVHAMAAALDAAYNAGPVAVCHSPMVAHFNAGDEKAGCSAFKGWYVRASGVVRRGLISRRNSEAKLCLQGASERPHWWTDPPPEDVKPWWQRLARKILLRGA